MRPLVTTIAVGSAFALACNLLIGLDGDTEITALPDAQAPDADLEAAPTVDAGADTRLTGELRVIAGDVGGSGFRDGPAADARFGRLQGITVDRDGNIYVLDALNAVIRKIAAGSLEVTTLAGQVGVRGGDDGIFSAARFDELHAIVFDGDHSLYVTDVSSDHASRCTLRRIDLSAANVSTPAGGVCGVDDGAGAKARFGFSVAGLAWVDGLLYINDSKRIRTFEPNTKAVVTFCGTTAVGTKDGTCGVDAMPPSLTDAVLDPVSSRLFVGFAASRPGFATVDLKTTKAFATLPIVDPEVDGGALPFSSWAGLELSSLGAIPTALVSDGYRLRSFTPSNPTLQVVTGANEPGWVDGVRGSSSVRFERIGGIAARDRAAGTFLIADAFSVRLLTAQRVETVAGRGTINAYVEGVAKDARFALDVLLAFDRASKTVYIYDAGNQLIRALDLNTNTTRTIAGKRGERDFKDGDSGAEARLSDEPDSFVYDGHGHLYLSDSGTVNVRRVDVATGATKTLASISLGASLTMDAQNEKIYFARGSSVQIWDPNDPTVTKSVAGVEGARGTTDGTALEARFLTASGLCLDTSMNALIISDIEAGTIRKLDLATNKVTTIAGAAGQLAHVDAVGAEARFRAPKHLACTGQGEAFVTDAVSSTLRRIDLATGGVTTVAGVPSRSVIAPGPLPASLNRPIYPILVSPREIVMSSAAESAIVLVTLPEK